MYQFCLRENGGQFEYHLQKSIFPLFINFFLCLLHGFFMVQNCSYKLIVMKIFFDISNNVLIIFISNYAFNFRKLSFIGVFLKNNAYYYIFLRNIDQFTAYKYKVSFEKARVCFVTSKW